MICIYGKSGSGKDIFSELLIQNNDFVLCKRPTTRPKRYNSVDNNYVFMSEKEFENNDNIVFKTQFREWWYGVYKEHLKSHNNLLVLTIDGITANKIKKEYPSTILIEIRADKNVRKNRCIQRETNPDIFEINRRMNADDKDYKNLEFKPDYIIDNNIDDIFFRNLKNEAKRIGGLLSE